MTLSSADSGSLLSAPLTSGVRAEVRHSRPNTESLAYEITKMVMENNEGMMQIHSSAAETLPENADKNTFLPYHPGAVRYFDEKGIEIPAELRP